MGALGFIAKVDYVDPPRRMDGVKFSQVALLPPFSVAAPLADEWRLYVVHSDNVLLSGASEIIRNGPLQKGTVIGILASIPHSFASVTGDASEPLCTDWREMPVGTRASADEVVIAFSRLPQSSTPFISLLGSFIRIDPEEHGGVAARIGVLIDWIGRETMRDDPVTADVIQRFAEIIALEIWRVRPAHSVLFSDLPGDAEYDARIWRAIAAISTEPQRHWTVETMAEIAGMSRSAFAARYHETVGQTPMRSLRRLRMHRAAMALASPGPQVIAPLADAMGYGSDAAFNRAFAKEFGHPPKRYGLSAGSKSGGRWKT